MGPKKKKVTDWDSFTQTFPLTHFSSEQSPTFVDFLCGTGAPIRGVEVVRAAAPGQRAALTTRGGLRVRVTCVPTAAVVMRREGGAATIYHVHGL